MHMIVLGAFAVHLHAHTQGHPFRRLNVEIWRHKSIRNRKGAKIMRANRRVNFADHSAELAGTGTRALVAIAQAGQRISPNGPMGHWRSSGRDDSSRPLPTPIDTHPYPPTPGSERFATYCTSFMY